MEEKTHKHKLEEIKKKGQEDKNVKKKKTELHGNIGEKKQTGEEEVNVLAIYNDE